MPSRLSSRDRRSAFTLIELMVVLALIGVMTALIVPEMKGTFEDALLRSNARELVDAFELASSRAISLNQPNRFNLDVQTGRYQIERRSRAGGPEDFVPLKDVAGSQGKLDSRITVEMNRPNDVTSEATGPTDQPEPGTISFYPDGTADAAEIRLRDRAGFQLILQVNPVTSRVHVAEPEHE